MDIHIDDSKIKFAAWAIGIAFTAYFAANSLYVEHPEAASTTEFTIAMKECDELDPIGEL